MVIIIIIFIFMYSVFFFKFTLVNFVKDFFKKPRVFLKKKKKLK